MTNSPITIGILVGSTRVGNNSTVITNWVIDHIDKSLKSIVNIQIFEPCDLIGEPVSTILPKLVTTFSEYDSVKVQKFSIDISNCQCFIIISPVYNGIYSGQLKCMLDYLYHEYKYKPCLNIVHGGKDTELAMGGLLTLESRLNLQSVYNLSIHDPREYVTGELKYITDGMDPLLMGYNECIKSALEILINSLN